MIRIGRRESWYRPYFVDINGKSIEISSILIYDESGVVILNKRGWLESNSGHNDISEIFVSEVARRVKEKFDGKIFAMKDNDRPYYEKDTKYILYIPNSIAKFAKTKRELCTDSMIIDIWESEVFKAKIEVYRNFPELQEKLNNLSEMFNDLKSKYSPITGGKEVAERFRLMADLVDQYNEEKERIKTIDLNTLPD